MSSRAHHPRVLAALATCLAAVAQAQGLMEGHAVEAVLARPLGAVTVQGRLGVKAQRAMREAFWRHDVATSLGATYRSGSGRIEGLVAVSQPLGAGGGRVAEWAVHAGLGIRQDWQLELRLRQGVGGGDTERSALVLLTSPL